MSNRKRPRRRGGQSVVLPAPKTRRGKNTAGSHTVRVGKDGEFIIETGSRGAKPRAFRIAHTYGWRFRRILLPLYVLAGLLAAGAALHQPGGLRGTMVLAPLLSGTVLLISWRRWLHTWAARAYTSLCLLVATIILTTFASLGISKAALGTSTMLWVAAACPWWWRNKWIAAKHVEPAKDQPEDEWTKYVACEGGPIPVSRLTGRRATPNGWEADVLLVRGKQNATKVLDKLENVASALGESMENIALERHPTGKANLAHITFLRNNPLHKIQKWDGTGFDPDTGIMNVGPYASGGLAQFRAWAPPGSGLPGGATHSLISGTTGSGKSQFLSLLALAYMKSGVVVTWVLDPQNGQSLPELADHVDWYAYGIGEGIQMLRAARQLMYARNSYMGRVLKLAAFTPTYEFPMLRLIIDEAHAVFKDPLHKVEAVAICEDLAKLGRKCGIGLDLVTQIPILTELGNSEVLRSMLQSGTIVCFRCAGRMTSNLAFQGSLHVDPTQIPKQFSNGTGSAGLMYLAGATAREAAARSWLVTDVAVKAAAYAPFAPPLDDFSARAAGPVYAARHDRHGDDDEITTEQILAGLTAPAPAAPPPAAAPAVTITGVTDDQQPAAYRDRKVTAADVVTETLRRAGAPMSKGDVIVAAGKVAVEWGRTEPYHMRMIGEALRVLKDAGQVHQADDRSPYSLARAVAPDSTPAAAPPRADAAAPSRAPAHEDHPQAPADGFPSGPQILDAIDWVVRFQFGSPQMLQRKLGITDTQADTLMGVLHEWGVVAPAGKDGVHAVLRTVEQLDRAKAGEFRQTVPAT